MRISLPSTRAAPEPLAAGDLARPPQAARAGSIGPAAPVPAARAPVDLGTRLLHMLLALSFATVYLTAESETRRLVHVGGGYVLAGVLGLRLVWGLFGPRTAKLGVLVRRAGMGRVWLHKARQGQWQQSSYWFGLSQWLLSLAVLGIYASCVIAALSGIASYNELWGAGWIQSGLEALHDGFGNGAMAAVSLHLGLLATIRVWRGPQALRPMWRADANPAGGR